MLQKKRLLHQFALPANQARAYDVEWRRPKDLFGDYFSMRARVEEERIHFDYLHRPAGASAEAKVWSLTIALSPTGRAKVEASAGIHPAIKSVYRAAALVDQATRHLQANPALIGAAPTAPANRP